MFHRLIALRICIAACLGADVSGALAQSEPLAVHLSELPQVRTGLCDALRIQLSGVATVSCSEGAVLPLEARIAEVSRQTAARSARLGAFVVPLEGSNSVQMVLVSGRSDHALVIFEPVRDRAEPSVDRGLALKVAEALDSLIAAESAASARDSANLTLGPALAAPSHSDSPKPKRSWNLLLEAGYGALIGSDFTSVARAQLGTRVRIGHLRLELALAGMLLRPERSQNGAGSVNLEGYGVGIAARVLRPLGRFELGVELSGAYTDISASAVSAAGNQGRGHARRGQVQLSALLRLYVYRTAYLSVTPGLQFYPAAQAFVLDDQTALRRGHLAAELPLVIGVQTP